MAADERGAPPLAAEVIANSRDARSGHGPLESVEPGNRLRQRNGRGIRRCEPNYPGKSAGGEPHHASWPADARQGHSTQRRAPRPSDQASMRWRPNEGEVAREKKFRPTFARASRRPARGSRRRPNAAAHGHFVPVSTFRSMRPSRRRLYKRARFKGIPCRGRDRWRGVPAGSATACPKRQSSIPRPRRHCRATEGPRVRQSNASPVAGLPERRARPKGGCWRYGRRQIEST